MNNNDFFNSISDFYDSMINFDSALQRRIDFFSKFNPKGKALDLGCGTGLDSIALSKLGLIVTASDQSSGMIHKAESNSQIQGVDISFITSPIQQIFLITKDKFDFIISMGNTLANIDEYQLNLLLENLYAFMNTGGTAVFQILNFEMPPSSGIYTIHKYEDELQIIDRFYEIESEKVWFCIESQSKKSGQSNKYKTQIFPHTKSVWEKLIDAKKFSIKFYGNSNLEEFNLKKSKDLFVILKTIAD